MDLALAVTQFLKSHGADLAGFADLTPLPAAVRSDMPRGVSFAVALRPDRVAPIRSGPTLEYFDEYTRVNALLGELSVAAAHFLQERRFRAISSAATNEGIDPQTHSTRLPHKTVATLAGLGWIGKSALLVTETFGSAIRLNRVLTDAPLPTAEPVIGSRCGTCDACVTACPGRAPSGKAWSSGMGRDEVFNAFDCRLAARRIALERTGIEETFCGICIAVCPWTERYLRRHSQPPIPAGGTKPEIRSQKSER
jgi:epoxyqueuosine reductase